MTRAEDAKAIIDQKAWIANAYPDIQTHIRDEDTQAIQQIFANKDRLSNLEVANILLALGYTPKEIYTATPDNLLELVQLRSIGSLYNIEKTAEYRQDLMTHYHTTKSSTLFVSGKMGTFPKNTSISDLLEHGAYPEDIETIKNKEALIGYEAFTTTAYVTKPMITEYYKSQNHTAGQVKQASGTERLSSYYGDKALCIALVKNNPALQSKVDPTEMLKQGFTFNQLREMKIPDLSSKVDATEMRKQGFTFNQLREMKIPYTKILYAYTIGPIIKFLSTIANVMQRASSPNSAQIRPETTKDQAASSSALVPTKGSEAKITPKTPQQDKKHPLSKGPP
jgi:hypothetical protein